jgi:hypothetical protein
MNVPRARHVRYFTPDEAQAMLGKGVQTRVQGHRIPQGAQGQIVYARLVNGGYELGIQWQRPSPPWMFVAIPRPPFVVVSRQRPLDWVRKDQYEKYLAEVTPEPIGQDT